MSVISRVSDKSITVVVGGRVRSIQQNSVNFKQLREALKAVPQDESLIKDLLDISSFIARETYGRVQVSNDEVRFDGKKVEGLISTRILAHLVEGFSIAPLARFLDKLMDNPLVGVREDLFAWLESGDMPITEDGDLIAYKAVQKDFYSHHSGKHGKVLHALNTVVTMPREEVDADRRNECSYGLHFCSYGYLSNYHGGTSHVIIVKINPADVVAIPTDYHRQKGRTWRMEVIDVVPDDETRDALRGRLVISKRGTYEEGVQSTAEISDFSNNELGQDGRGNSITVGRLRGLLAHGGIAYAADKLGQTEGKVSAWVELINFPFENLGSLDDKPADDAGLEQEDQDGDENNWDEGDDINDDDAQFSNAEDTALPLLDTVAQAAPAPAPAPVAVDPSNAPNADLVFNHDGIDYPASFVLQQVEQHGQRGYAQASGVPRTTLQTWLKKARDKNKAKG